MTTLIAESENQESLAPTGLIDIEQLDDELTSQFKDVLTVQQTLSRAVVSFQANKARPVYRWFKYKEAFSAALVEYLLSAYRIETGRLLDPFAGAGTALFAASDIGIAAEGIELLPIGQAIVKTRQLVQQGLTDDDLKALTRWIETDPWQDYESASPLPELRITKGAYPPETKIGIEKYLSAMTQESERVQAILKFVLLSVLESVSYTRKDGQYLRWDYRSGRRVGSKPFDKGLISDFTHAVRTKLREVVNDLSADIGTPDLFARDIVPGEVLLHQGSCLEVLPRLASRSFDVIFTSPPYCNRYDYTRTYALELALLGCDERRVVELRQDMLSCTVENRAKDLLKLNPAWSESVAVADNQCLLQAILSYLERQKDDGSLNNNGIPRMVRGYFYEMACVIQECHRVLRPNSLMFMVNDNVRYAGAAISVDLILSSMAEELGFQIERILVLPNGKGNSSQQMGEHGRESLRKCVYVWRKVL
jgi:DNA modification methylase